MTNQDEVAIQRAVERALVNIYWPTVTRKEKWNDFIRDATEAINGRTDFSPLRYGPSPEPIKIKGEIKGDDIRLVYDIPPPPSPPPSREVIDGQKPSEPHQVHSLNRDWTRSDILAVYGVLLQLISAILLLSLLVRL